MTTSRGPRIRFGLRNFKAFRYLEDLELKPLTLLVGANSTGKSSIFQSLLLLKQTSAAGSRESILKFNGSLVKLGGFDTVISDFDTRRYLEYWFEVDGPSPCRVELSFMSIATTKAAQIKKVVVAEGASKFLYDEDGAQQFTSAGASRRPLAMEFDEFWPEVLHFEPAEPKNTENLREWRGYGLIRNLIERQLRYLGPVRADPRPFYPVEEEPVLGARGKGAIPYLLRKRNDKVRYASGPAGEIREGTLLEAINEWLHNMQVTTSLSIEPLESVAYTAAVRSPSVTGRSVNLAQVGFGISQLLPVLILGLKNPSEGFLLFEQPEIHLHPRLQGGLGDFLIGVARAGRTVMVETHSDHLVHRIRRRIAEDPTGELAQMVQILFVHAGTEDDPGSYIEPLSVDESGAIVNCPEDFFSESADEAFAILHARRNKRQTP